MGGVTYPRGVAVAPDGSVYVAEATNNRIQKFNSTGSFLTSLISYAPWGVAVAPDGSVYVADPPQNLIQEFDSNGNFVAQWDSPGSDDGQFRSPAGVAASPSGGFVYVADTDNSRIQRMIMTTGGVKTLFETTIPITQAANTTQDYTSTIGTLNLTGKLYLQSELKNTQGQTIARSEYPFYIVAGNTVLLYSTDKKYYKPNETATISGEVRNLSSIAASGLVLTLASQRGTQILQLYAATIDVPAEGSYPFTVTTTSDSEGAYTLTGKVVQNSSTLAEITDRYEVTSPKVTTTVIVPEVAGNERFGMSVEVKNEGKTTANIQYTVDSSLGNRIDEQVLTIPAGETKYLLFDQQITASTTYVFTFGGDLSQTIAKTVAYGLGASIQFGSQGASSGPYPEGRVSIPVTITNIGSLDESVTVNYALNQQSGIISHQSKTYYIPRNSSISDAMTFDLTEGAYQLVAGSSLPTALTTADISVLKQSKMDMALTVGAQTSGLIPASVAVTNLGFNNIDGSVRISVAGSQGSAIWTGEQTVAQLATQNSQTLTFSIDPAAATPGNYTVTAVLISNDGQQLATRSSLLTVQCAIIGITQLPQYQTIGAGQEATFAFKVKNTGNQEGPVSFTFKAYDLVSSTQTEWLKPGEEKQIAFAVLFPNDLEEKDYFADYELKGQGAAANGQIKYHLAGINLTVNASLDKQYYSAGDTAHLTLTVSNQSATTGQNLFTRVNYHDYNDQRPFTLNGSQILTFDIPLAQITGEKLFYGIYYEGGRSLYLNSVYVYKAGELITITTDKQVYDPGETMSVAISSQQPALSGQMTLTGPGGYSETFDFTGSATRSIVLPAAMTAGTYQINAQLTTQNAELKTASLPIDVNGIQVKVTEARLDKPKYAATDAVNLSLTISSNRAISAKLRTWIVDPSGRYTEAGEGAISLSATEPLLATQNAQLATASMGIHRLVYGVYSGDMLLSSGSEAFDVGEAVLMGLATDKTDYPTKADVVTAKASMYGTVGASMELKIDGATIKTEEVTLNGFATLKSELPAVSPGPHTLRAVLMSGGLSSSKETIFVYGSRLPDLTATLSSQGSINSDGTMTLTAVVMNQGKDASVATTVSLFDSDSIIESKPLRALNGGDSDTITFAWNVSGKTGDHVIKAVVDPDNLVAEFDKQNNSAQISIRIPDDVIPPVTMITIGAPNYTSGGSVYAALSSIITLSAVDNASGVAKTEYRIDNSAWTIYAPFMLTTEGTHVISYRSTDNAGNVEIEKLQVVIIDMTPPTGSLVINNDARYTNNPSVTLTLSCIDTASGCARMQFSSDAIIWSSPEAFTTTRAWTLSSGDGPKTIYLQYLDGVGNVSAVYGAGVTLDATLPALRISTLPDGSYTNNSILNISGAATDNIALQGVTINNTAVTVNPDGSFSQVVTLTTGTNTITTVATDKAVNIAKDERNVTLDQTAPVITITSPADNSVTNEINTSVTGTVDKPATVTVTVNGGAPVSADLASAGFSLPLTLVYGQNTIMVTAADLAGNTGTAKRTVTFDGQRPSLAVIYPAEDISTSQNQITLTGQVSDLTPVAVTVTMDGNVFTPAVVDGKFEQTITFTVQKTYQINVTAVDEAGNQSLVQRNVIYNAIPQNLGVFGTTGVSISGGYLDSYDYSKVAYNGIHGSNVSVGTNSTEDGAINLSGGAVDYGDAYVGPTDDPAKAITTSGGAVIYGSKGALSSLKNMTPMSDPGGGTPASFTNGTTLTSGTYRVSSINLSGSGIGTINGNVTLYVTGSLSLSGSAQIVILPGGSLTVYLDGKLNVSGGAIVNETLNPHNLTIYGTSTCTTATYSGSSAFYGVIYAPTASTTISGGNIYGSVIGGSVTISGGAAVHYDESLGNIGN